MSVVESNYEKSGWSIYEGLPKIGKELFSWLTQSSVNNEEDFRIAKLLVKIVFTIFATNLIGFILALIEPKNKLITTAVFYGIVFLTLAGFVTLLRYGKIKMAGWSLVVFMWCVVSFATLFFGGLRSQTPVVFVVVIMFMGSFLGGRAAFILSLVTIVFLGLVAILDSYDYMPEQLGPEYSPLNAWSSLFIALLLMSVLLNNSLTSIKESQERYQLAVSGTHAGLWDWNILTNEVYYSSSLKEMLGYSPSEFPDHFSSFTNVMHPEDLESVKAALDKHLDLLQNKYDVEFRLRMKTGDYRWFHARGKAIRKKQGKPYRMVGSIVDVTERKLSDEFIVLKNEELLKINDELDRFVYSASHDLRAPISSLLGLIEVARLEKDPESIQNLLDMQKRSLQKLDKFIFDIVSYSRNNRVDLEIGRIDFQELLNDTYDQLQYMDKLKGLKRINEIDEDIHFYSDQKRIAIVLNNLISNAIKYSVSSKSDTFIKTRIKKTEQGVSIHVVDNGEGIDNEHIHRIYDMFYRASEQSVGSGIGLYIVKEVVQKLKGTIEVQSQKYHGSEFIVRLPDLKKAGHA